MATARPGGGPAGQTTDEKIARVAALLCLHHGITHQQLGDLIGVKDGSSMSLRMNGKRSFKPAEIERMAEVFGVGVEVFFAGPDGLFRVPLTSGVMSSRSTTLTLLRTPHELPQAA